MRTIRHWQRRRAPTLWYLVPEWEELHVVPG
jgi:hypothetical protein